MCVSRKGRFHVHQPNPCITPQPPAVPRAHMTMPRADPKAEPGTMRYSMRVACLNLGFLDLSMGTRGGGVAKGHSLRGRGHRPQANSCPWGRAGGEGGGGGGNTIAACHNTRVTGKCRHPKTMTCPQYIREVQLRTTEKDGALNTLTKTAT